MSKQPCVRKPSNEERAIDALEVLVGQQERLATAVQHLANGHNSLADAVHRIATEKERDGLWTNLFVDLGRLAIDIAINRKRPSKLLMQQSTIDS